jgi:RHS repeat-associated protein
LTFCYFLVKQKVGEKNMNGRLYDPVIGRFFSPDKYVANSSFTQDFNRYSYARNCPLSYTDPSGEFIWWVPLLVGAWIGMSQGALMGSLAGATGWQMAGYIAGGAAIGGLTGLASAGIGAAMGSAMTTAGVSSFIGGVGTGAVAGGAGGALNGLGMGLLAGKNGNDLRSGVFWGGLMGMASGMVMGGITGGINATAQKGVFDRGCEELGVNPWDPIPEELRTDEFVTKANETWYPHGPDAYHKVDLYNLHTEDNFGAIKAHPTLGFSGKPTIWYHYENAFRSPLQLFTTMGHELVHVSQYAALGAADFSTKVLQNKNVVSILDYYARIYSNRIGIYRDLGSGDWLTRYAQYHEILDGVNFPWTKINPTFIYPF